MEKVRSVGNLPEKKFRAGPVSVTVWKNQGKGEGGETVEYKTVSLERSYKDKQGEWQSTHSLRINDLPKASIALQKAYEYIILREQGGEGNSFPSTYIN